MKRLFLGLAVVVTLGSVTFWAGTRLNRGDNSEAQVPASQRIDSELATRQAAVAADALLPKFVGTIRGIALAPTEVQWSAEFQQSESARRAKGCDTALATDPHGMDFAHPVVLPARFSTAGVLAETGRPDVFPCNGKLMGANWDYVSTNADGTPSNVWISRSVAKGELFDGAAARVSSQTINGHPAVVVKPVTADGFAQNAMVLFPEAFGVTKVETFNVSEAELVEIATAVATAIGGN